jgi:Ca-activated chloride channel family protein
VLQDILRGWDTLRKKADVLLVMDVSGSMADQTATGQSKLTAAEDAALQGLGVLNDDDDVGLWAFSSRPPGQAPYTELVPPSRLGGVHPALTVAIRGLGAEGGTALYATIRAARQYMLAHTSQDRINAIVVLTDGHNEYSPDNDKDRLLRELGTGTLDQSVRVFGIAFGAEADTGVLTDIAKASRAAAYDATDPANIDAVFTSVLSNF